jgi:hypothetical protein
MAEYRQSAHAVYDLDSEGNFWLEQNIAKRSKWAKFAHEGHDVAWEFAPGGGYSGRMLIDGEIYTPSEVVNKFLKLVK